LSRTHTLFYDKLGIIASSTCMIHCLIGPIAFILLPVSSQASNNDWIHWILLALVLPVAILAFYQGYLQHKMKPILTLAILGLLLLLVAGFSGHWHSRAEILLSLAGSLVLVGAHLWNMKRIRSLVGHRSRAVVEPMVAVPKNLTQSSSSLGEQFPSYP